MNPDLEAAIVGAFIAKQKRERLLLILRSPQRTRKLQEQFPHESRWDPRVVVPIPVAQQTAERLHAELLRRGAKNEVYLISANPKLDARSWNLVDALQEVVGSSSGTLVSCIPDRLAYFEGEAPGDRFILAR